MPNRGVGTLPHPTPLLEEKANAMIETNEGREVDLCRLLTDRAASYRFLSRLIMKPLSSAEVDELAAQQLERRVGDLEGAALLAEGFNDMGRGLHRRHTGTVRLLSTDYTMCFDGVASYGGLVASPYASVFVGSVTGEKAVLCQEPRDRDLAAYRSEGVTVDESLHLPEDHLGFELSFMADISDKMHEEWSKGDIAEVARLTATSEDFLLNHILVWYGAFYDVALNILETRFYRGVLKAIYGYLRHDATLLTEIRGTLAR